MNSLVRKRKPGDAPRRRSDILPLRFTSIPSRPRTLQVILMNIALHVPRDHRLILQKFILPRRTPQQHIRRSPMSQQRRWIKRFIRRQHRRRGRTRLHPQPIRHRRRRRSRRLRRTTSPTPRRRVRSLSKRAYQLHLIRRRFASCCPSSRWRRERRLNAPGVLDVPAPRIPNARLDALCYITDLHLRLGS